MANTEESLKRDDARLESLVFGTSHKPLRKVAAIESFLDRLLPMIQGGKVAPHALRMFRSWKTFLMDRYGRVYAGDVGRRAR